MLFGLCVFVRLLLFGCFSFSGLGRFLLFGCFSFSGLSRFLLFGLLSFSGLVRFLLFGLLSFSGLVRFLLGLRGRISFVTLLFDSLVQFRVVLLMLFVFFCSCFRLYTFSLRCCLYPLVLRVAFRIMVLISSTNFLFVIVLFAASLARTCGCWSRQIGVLALPFAVALPLGGSMAANEAPVEHGGPGNFVFVLFAKIFAVFLF